MQSRPLSFKVQFLQESPPTSATIYLFPDKLKCKESKEQSPASSWNAASMRRSMNSVATIKTDKSLNLKREQQCRTHCMTLKDDEYNLAIMDYKLLHNKKLFHEEQELVVDENEESEEQSKITRITLLLVKERLPIIRRYIQQYSQKVETHEQFHLTVPNQEEGSGSNQSTAISSGWGSIGQLDPTLKDEYFKLFELIEKAIQQAIEASEPKKAMQSS